jgi:hypothetical protein
MDVQLSTILLAKKLEALPRETRDAIYGQIEAGKCLEGKAETALAPEAVEAIKRQRDQLFDAMAFVDTTVDSLDEEDISQRGTLRAAYRLLDDIAGKLELIGSYGTDKD